MHLFHVVCVCGCCRLPYVLGTLPNLKSLVLDGNPLKSIRRDIILVGRGTPNYYVHNLF